MKTFEKTITINCTLEELFDFHLDMKNLEAITPPNIKVEVVNKDFIPKEGGVLKINTIKNFIPIKWEVKIQKMQKPNILVDLALKSPFKYWEHSHIFTQKGNICEMKDIVKYELPFGFVGSLFDFLIKKELTNMFTHRHTVTKKILEKKS